MHRMQFQITNLDLCKAILFLFLAVLFLALPSHLTAATTSITSSTDFKLGFQTNTESSSKEGELKLQGDGSWAARSWKAPYLTLTDGSTITSDGTYTYLINTRDLRFVRYIPDEDRWQNLATAPYMTNSGSDMIVLGDYVYAIFGGYQKFFARYSISQDTWETLESLPDFAFSGSSIVTDGTNLFILRGGNTTDFWKYNPSTTNWTVLSAPPATMSAGADLVFDDSTGPDYLYSARGAGTTTFYRYDISANTWSTMAVAPATLSENGNVAVSNGKIFMLRGISTTTLYQYLIATNTWSTLAVTPGATRYVGVTFNASENLLYVFRGNSTYDWWKYNIGTGTYVGHPDLPNTPGTGADLVYADNFVYYRRGNNSNLFYRYNIVSGTWVTAAVVPGTINDDTKGIKAGNDLYYYRASNTTTAYKFNLTSQTWSTLAVTPANVSYGSSLVYTGSGDYVYGTRGGLTTVFWRYSISGDSWDDVSVADLPAGASIGYGSRLVSDGTDIYAITGQGIAKMYKYTVGSNTWSLVGTLPFAPYYGTDIVAYNGNIYAQSGHYKTDFWEYSFVGGTWRRLPDMSGYYANDVGPYNGGSIAADSNTGTLYSISGANISRLLTFSTSAFKYPTSGTWVSNTFDLSFVSSWTSIVASTAAPSDSSISFETRTSANNLTWSSWAPVSGTTISSAAARYIQVRATLTASTDKTQTPILYSIAVNYDGDTTVPTNPNTFTGVSQSVGGVSLSSGSSYKYANPYFSWSGAADSGVGVAGYYVYFGTDSNADPATQGSFQSESYYTVTSAMSTDVYYLRLKTKDLSGNTAAAVTGFTYEYTGVSPPSTQTYSLTSDFTAGTASQVSTANDSIVLNGKTGFWQQKRLSMIPGGAGYGAGLAYVSSSSKLYATRGQNTTSFYSYDIATDTWSTLANTPVTVYQGGDVVEGPSGYLYAIPGKLLTTFWKYNIASNTWSAAADSPLSFYYGTSLIYDGSRYIYAMRGNLDDSFLKYDTTNDSWETLTNVNFGSPTSQIDNNVYLGGDLAYDRDETIYALQGNARTGFSSYNITNGNWTVLPNTPVLPYDGSQISFDSTSNAVYLTSGWTNPFVYKYDIGTQEWTKLTDAPATIQYGSAMRNIDGTLYLLRGGSTTTFWKYNISKATWQIPTLGLFGTEFRGTDYRTFGYGAEIVKGDGNYYYLTRGSYDNLFVRYDATSGESVRMTDAPGGFFSGSALAYFAPDNKIYAIPSQYTQNLYVYDVATDTWSEETSDVPPVASNVGSMFVSDGAQYLYWLRGNSNGVYRYDTDATAGTRWSALANAPSTFGYGADMVILGGYMYATRGNNTISFYRYDIGGGTWSDPLVADLPTGALVYNDGFLVKSGSNTLIACRGGNSALCYQYSVSGNSWSAIENAPADINQGGAAASNGSTQMLVIAGPGTNTYNNGLYSYIIGSGTSAFEESGTYSSPSHDLAATYKFANISLDYESATNTSLLVESRTSPDNSTYSAWSTATELKAVGTSYSYKVNSTPQRYIQVRFTLSSGDGVYSGKINSYTVEYYSDTATPSNPSVLSAYDTNSMGVGVTSNTWNNFTSPYFDWTEAEAVGGASDTATGSGISGYYVYFGTSASGDPVASGTFTTSSEYTASSLTNGQTYYLRIQTLDSAGNISSGVWQPHIYKFDSVKPTNPSTLVSDPPGYSATNSYTFNWTGAVDADSGVYGYCYKTGETGFVEICTLGTTVTGITAYKTGVNTFYVRTIDNAGNYSNDYVTASYYYSSTAPSAPQAISATPTSSTDNEFAFAWSPPDIYYGAQAGLRYYYSVNAFPTVSNVNAVGLTTTYLTAGPYATQKGENILYVVAKDEAGNIDYNNYATVTFNADTSAPGIPTDLDIADVSVKESQSWKLALSWEPPAETGSGIAVYKVYSSTTATSCTSDFDSFTYISSTTGKSYVDTDLEQETYNYCVKACTSTNDCSVASETVSLYPDGKWRIAPTLVGEPSVTVLTKKATVTWFTGREANSFVKYGKSSGSYGSEVGSSEAVSDHKIQIVGLDPGIKYYYKVLWTDEDGNLGESSEYTFTTNAAPFVSNVTLSSISLYDAYVNFTVKNATSATVQYGKTETYGGVSTISTSTAETSYTVQLEELSDGTTYNFRIAAKDEEGNEYLGDNYTFVTLPVPEITALKVQQVEGVATATLRFLWISNTRIDSKITYYPENNIALSEDYYNATPTAAHQAVISNLLDETDYVFIITGKDTVGNVAAYPTQKITTSADLRSPEVINANVETTISGVGADARAQIIISWDTDEPSTSQIEYGEGTSGNYTLSSQEDAILTSNHTMTIPGLSPSKIYHFRIISKDKNGNTGNSEDIVVITPSATRDALNLVVDKLSKTFGFLKQYNK